MREDQKKICCLLNLLYVRLGILHKKIRSILTDIKEKKGQKIQLENLESHYVHQIGKEIWQNLCSQRGI